METRLKPDVRVFADVNELSLRAGEAAVSTYSFEYRREARRLHAQEPTGERSQPRVASGCAVPVGQVGPNPEQLTDERSHTAPLRRSR